MKTRILAALAALLVAAGLTTGCQYPFTAVDQTVHVHIFTIPGRPVTCFVATSAAGNPGTIDCIPDKDLTK